MSDQLIEFPDRKNVIFDSTKLNEVQLCAARMNFAHELNLRPPTKAQPLEEGDMLHKMLEFYYKGIMSNQGIIYEDSPWTSLVESALELGENHSITELELSQDDANQVLYQFSEYTKKYRYDGLVIKAVEEPFIIELYGDEELGIYYTGKIDVIADVPNFGLSVVDHKKASRNQYPSSLSNQFTGYGFAVGLPRVLVNKIGFQKTIAVDERMRRYNLFYTQDQFNRWKYNTIWWGKQYAFYIETESWPENRTSCDKYAGCIYSSICESSTDEGRAHIMATNFVVGEAWDVTSHLKKE